MYYNDYDSIDEDTRNLYRKAMAAFGGIAPTYHIELLEKPTIYWDFHSLLLGIQMMFSFMLVDDAKPLRLCKHCQKVFLGSRANSAFCSARCKNQYNVYKTRAKSGRIKRMDENMALTPHETREILFYKTDNGDVKVEILLYQENLWLTQAKMAELFEVQKAAISKHLKNIFTSGELMEDSVFPFWKQLRQMENYPHGTIIWTRSLRSLSGELQKGHHVPHLGEQDTEGVHHQGLCHGR